jgi:methylated-DNA-[protein]-cysteine S-methyltransferase
MIKKSAIVGPNDVFLAPYVQKSISPIGDIYLGASEKGLRWIKLLGDMDIEEKPNLVTEKAADQLKLYFAKELQTFQLTLDLGGYSDFSQRVWQQLMDIPYGQTISYMQLALRLGDAKCIRAAATANGRNPIPIIIPCHRVIGSNGDLTGFALGLDVKKALLSIENPMKYNITQGKLEI